jgi:hypothetical protein
MLVGLFNTAECMVYQCIPLLCKFNIAGPQNESTHGKPAIYARLLAVKHRKKHDKYRTTSKPASLRAFSGSVRTWKMLSVQHTSEFEISNGSLSN